MELEKIPRGRKDPRPIDAAPVPEPHGDGHEYSDGLRPPEATPTPVAPLPATPLAQESVAVPVATAPAADAPAAPSEPAPPAPSTHSEFIETPAEALAADWIGWKATDEMGRTVGRIEGRLEPEWLIVRDRRGRHLLAPASDAIAGGSKVFLPYEHDLITSAPQLHGSDGLDPETADAARAHYAGNNAAH